MLLKDFPLDDLGGALREGGIHLDTGAFTTHLVCDLPEVVGEFADAYAEARVETAPTIDDFHVAMRRWRRWGAVPTRTAHVDIDGRPTFVPFPLNFAFPMLESTLNWCIAKQVFRYVTFHAAAVERDGRAAILSGPSGSGKSTLCAALSQGGWRLLSDEIVLLRPEAPEIVANPRPISLKNEAIELISEFAPQARFSAAYAGTARGTISFLCPSERAVANAGQGAEPTLAIAPTFRANAPTEAREMGKAEGFMWLVKNAVNYFATQKPGFRALGEVAERCRFYRLVFGDLHEAVDLINRLHDADSKQEAA